MIPEDQLLSEIERLADGESPPTCTEFDEKARYHTDTVLDRWESWNAALQEAGFAPNLDRDISDEELLSEISRLADNGSPPTYSEFNDKAEYSTKPVLTRWGSWNVAVREAGFAPNDLQNLSTKRLLTALRADSRGQIPPAWDATTYDERTYNRRFGSQWKACVQAGLQPYRRRPLTHTESQAFFEEAAGQQKPRYRLIGLFAQFTGLTLQLIEKFSPDWISATPGETVITIPSSETQSGERWTFKLPRTWIDKTGKKRETGLAGFPEWFLEVYGSISFSKSAAAHTIHRIAQDAGLPDRQRVNRNTVGSVPIVRPDDLRATGGVQMARNGAPSRRIRRHLGIEHTNWKADVEDFFLWLYVHEDYEHPEYDPPDVVLDSVL